VGPPPSLGAHTHHEQLDRIAAELNERPRGSLGWRTSAEKFNELLAMTG
jgi:IS30 family transposase